MLLQCENTSKYFYTLSEYNFAHRTALELKARKSPLQVPNQAWLGKQYQIFVIIYDPEVNGVRVNNVCLY